MQVGTKHQIATLTFIDGRYFKKIRAANVNLERHKQINVYSGGSRISRWGAPTRWGGHQPPTHTLFGKNVCEDERN